MGVFAAFGMAARRWYLLLPLVLLSAGAAWLAYIQMPATYAASAVYQVGVQPASGGRPVASTPQVNTAQVAGLLIGRMQGGANGGPTASTYTVSGRPGSSIITVSAQGDNPGQALDRVAAGHTRLGAQLTALQTERVVQTDGDLRLQATTPPTASAPIRTTGIKVFLVTLLFGSMLSLVFAAAVERSARRRRSLREQAEADAPTEVVAKIEAEPVSASDAHRTSAMATHDDVREPEPGPEPELEPQPEPEPESEPDDAGAYSARATLAGERTGEGTHALRAPSSGEGTHALRMAPPPEEEPVRGPAPAESDPATVAAAATSAIPVGTNDEVSSDAPVESLVTSAIPMGVEVSSEDSVESLVTSAIPVGTEVSSEDPSESFTPIEALTTSAIPMGVERSTEDPVESLVTTAIPIGLGETSDPPIEALTTSAIPIGVERERSSEDPVESLVTSAIPLGSEAPPEAPIEALTTSAIPTPEMPATSPADPMGSDPSPAAAAMRTALNLPSRPVAESVTRPDAPERPRGPRSISPVRGSGPGEPPSESRPPRRPAHALSDPTELRLPTPPAPLGPRPPEPSIGLLKPPASNDPSGRPRPGIDAGSNEPPSRPGAHALSEPPDRPEPSGNAGSPPGPGPEAPVPPLSLVPPNPAGGMSGPSDPPTDRDRPEPPPPPRLRAVPPLGERPDPPPRGNRFGGYHPPPPPPFGGSDARGPAKAEPRPPGGEGNNGWLPGSPRMGPPPNRPTNPPAGPPPDPASRPSTQLPAERSTGRPSAGPPWPPPGRPVEPPPPARPVEPGRPSFGMDPRPEPVEHRYEPAGGTPTGFEPHERDERGGERPAAEWDDIASADDAFDDRPVEEPDEDWQVDENIAGGWQDFVEPDDDEPAEAEGAVAEADAEDEFGWPDFADDEDESDGAVAPSADAADPEVDADDGSWPGWDDERRTSRKAFTG